MSYETKIFDHLIGLKGFSDESLKNHFVLYNGYVNNFNKLNDILVLMEKEEKFGAPEYAELNRRLGWEFNGMRLHEYYFENLIKEPKTLAEDSELFKKIKKEWGSYKMWERDFRAMAAMRGVGWIVLYRDKVDDRLFNVWINEHDLGHFTGCSPLLVMDVFEHAYLTDYGIKRIDYVEAFFKVINWEEIEKRLE